MINNVVLVGRLTADPELKYSQTGTPIGNFRLAVDRGGGKDETDFLHCVAFQKTAELVSQYCDKGALIGVEGRVQSRTWEDKEGKRNYAVEIVANNVRFLESRKDAEARRAEAGQPQPQRQAAPAAAAAQVSMDEIDPADPFSGE